MEMLAPLALLWSAPAVVRGIRASLYLDNNTAGNALIRRDYANPFIASMVCVFWMLVERVSIDIWIGRVGTMVNTADFPTMYVKLPFPVLNRARFTRLFALLVETQNVLYPHATPSCASLISAFPS